jgi:hypothetical protein
MGQNSTGGSRSNAGELKINAGEVLNIGGELQYIARGIQNNSGEGGKSSAG